MLHRVLMSASRFTLRLVKSLAMRTLLLLSTTGGRSTVSCSYSRSHLPVRLSIRRARSKVGIWCEVESYKGEG